MSVHTRIDSGALQTRISVPSPSGARVGLVRTLATRDRDAGSALDSSLQTLADKLPSAPWHQVKRIVEDIFLAAGHAIPCISKVELPALVRPVDFAHEFLQRKAPPKTSESHYALLCRCVLDFAEAHQGLELAQVKGAHVQAWVDALVSSGLAAGSVRNQLGAVSSMFASAVKLGHVTANPCAGVEPPDAVGAVSRQPMEDGDFGKLLAHVAGTEWEAVVMLSRYAGLRLMDAVGLTAESVRFQDGACLLAVTAGKTGSADVLPVFEPLAAFLKGMAGKCGLLVPGLAEESASLLSRRFCALCDAVGIGGGVVPVASGRKYRTISFHSLRHSYVTWLSRLGIPATLRMKLAAHATEESHQRYDHTGAMDLHNQVKGYFNPAGS